MILSSHCEKLYKIYLFFILFSFATDTVKSQIKVFERPTNNDIRNTGLFFESSTRKRVELNGHWDISFNEGKNFSKFIVPIAYDFEGQVIFKKKFSLPEDILESYSFIFVAEGINYESEVKINNNFVSKHTGGFTPIIIPLTDGIIINTNEIIINVSNQLNFTNTLPLSDQINYSKVYGGITKDIYLVAVPKLFVLRNSINYSVDNLLSVKIINTAEIKSSNLFKYIDTAKVKNFFVQIKIARKSNDSDIEESEKIRFDIGDNNSIKVINELNINAPVLWTPETPELYLVKTIITSDDEKVLDENIIETGFTNLAKKSGQIFLSGREIRLNGINYYEDHPRYASALDYNEVEKDLNNIKTLGFNAVRVPGRCSHPYIVNLCNRIGLFLLQEVPFNEIAVAYFDNDKYIRFALNYLSDIIVRDENSPCIFAWGIGNDFDVSTNSALQYVRSARLLIDSLNPRFKYYTSRPLNEDICSEEVDFVGINFYERDYEYVKSTIVEITNKTRQQVNRKNNNIFVSYYGLSIQNDNSSGFSDIKSQEAQTKFINECYTKITETTFGNFIASYADWNSENPFNDPLDKNPYLQTNGIYTLNREQKQSTEFVKRILYNEDLPRIQEGNHVRDFPYVFIIAGIVMIVIFIYFINRDKKFRSSLTRCLYKPAYFFSLVKDQMIIPTGYNVILSITISLGLSLYFSSILYFYRENDSFDMILAKIFTNDSLKIFVSHIINNKFYLMTTLIFIILLLIFLTAFFLYFISFYTKGKSFFKNIYTICVWSTLPMLVFLIVGTVLYKLAESNPSFIRISLWIFIILFGLYLNRMIIGAKSLFDVRTDKVYLYGTVILIVIFALTYSYFSVFTGATQTISLVSNLTK